jgi:hypothetical protein
VTEERPMVGFWLPFAAVSAFIDAASEDDILRLAGACTGKKQGDEWEFQARQEEALALLGVVGRAIGQLHLEEQARLFVWHVGQMEKDSQN